MKIVAKINNYTFIFIKGLIKFRLKEWPALEAFYRN